MNFLVVMINVFGLAAFVALWLSITFIAVDIYKTDKVTAHAISLARISIIIKKLLITWFVLLGIAFTTADNLLPLFLYLLLFLGLYFYIKRLYGGILKAAAVIRRNGGTKNTHALIHGSVVKVGSEIQTHKSLNDFQRFKMFFWALNGFISVGVVVNFWLMDTGGSPVWEVALASVMMVIMLQVLFMPIYLIVKRVVFATLAKR